MNSIILISDINKGTKQRRALDNADAGADAEGILVWFKVPNFISWPISTSVRVESAILTSLYTVPIYYANFHFSEG